jgi:Mrp family chromosome partitioning ATPase
MLLLDSPPILSLADATVLSAMADGVLLVVDLSKTKRPDLTRARDSIEAVGGKLVGIVVNRLSPKAAGQYYCYYSQYSYTYTSNYQPPRKRGGSGKFKNPVAAVFGHRES